MDIINRLKRKIGKTMARRPRNQIVFICSLLLILVAVVAVADLCNAGDSFWVKLGSFLSPVPMYSQDLHWCGFIAYLFGTIVISGVIIATLTNILRTTGERYTNGTASYKFTNHILFLGYDDLMLGTIKKELEEDKSNGYKNDIVVAVPEKVASIRNDIYQHLSKEQRQKVIVIKSTRINVDDLMNVVQIVGARKIYIIGQPDEETHDAINLKSLSYIAAQNPRQASGLPTPSYYYLRNQSTFYLVHRMEYKAKNFKDQIGNAHLDYNEENIKQFLNASEPFNFHESIARHILYGNLDPDCDTLQLNTASSNPHIIIYGINPIGTALMRAILVTQHFPERRLHITMIDENARTEMHYLIGRHRPFFENCHYTFRDLTNPATDYEHPAQLDFIDVDIDFIQSDVANPILTDYIGSCAKNINDLPAIAICTNDSPQNMALALYMPRIVFENKIPIWVYQTGDNSMNAFVEDDGKNNIYSSIRIFSTTEYGVADRTSSQQWQFAKAVSDDYARHNLSEEERKKYQWEYSQPSDRWSSLYGAISKISMLRSIGKGHPPYLLTDDDIDRLAIAEHNRWNTEKLLNGWEPAKPGEGKNKFIHDKIVPFDKLDKATQNKDKDQIKVVVNELNRIGKTKNK